MHKVSRFQSFIFTLGTIGYILHVQSSFIKMVNIRQKERTKVQSPQAYME